MKNIEAVGALVITCLLSACGVNTPEPPPAWTPQHLLPPVPELMVPTPTHLPLPATATVYETPMPTDIPTLPSPTARPSITPYTTPTRVWNPPIWCERIPILVGTPDKSAKENAYLFGTSFSFWFMSYSRESSLIQSMYSDIEINAATFPGEDMSLLATHLKELSRSFEVRPNRQNVLALQLGAIGLINGRDSSIVLQETIATAKEIKTCFPEVSMVLVAPIPNRQQDPAIQLTFAGTLANEAKKYGWNTVNIGPLLLNPDGSVNNSLYKDTLHLKKEIYEQFGAPAIHAAIVGAP